MLWVLKRIVSMRQFFWAPKTYVKTDQKENIYIFTLNIFVYLNLWYGPKCMERYGCVNSESLNLAPLE